MPLSIFLEKRKINFFFFYENLRKFIFTVFYENQREKFVKMSKFSLKNIKFILNINDFNELLRFNKFFYDFLDTRKIK
jgi:hypothetical protein